MSAYLVLSATEPGTAPLSFDDPGNAIEWCKQNASRGRFRVVEVPNAHGRLPVIDVERLKSVYVT